MIVPQIWFVNLPNAVAGVTKPQQTQLGIGTFVTINPPSILDYLRRYLADPKNIFG